MGQNSRRHLLIVLLTAAFSVTSVAWGTSSANAAPPPPRPLIVAVGDTTASGVGASIPQLSYPNLVTSALKLSDICGPRTNRKAPSCANLQLQTFAYNSTDYDYYDADSAISSRVTEATALISERNHNADPNDDVKVITFDYGVDVFVRYYTSPRQVCFPTISVDCGRQLAFGRYDANEYTQDSYRRLREAAGPDTVIISIAHANSMVGKGCQWRQYSAFGDQQLEGRQYLEGLNQIIRGWSNDQGVNVKVADAYRKLGPNDFISDCVHPNSIGHAKYAAVVIKTALAG